MLPNAREISLFPSDYGACGEIDQLAEMISFIQPFHEKCGVFTFFLRDDSLELGW
jgi:hypothetical protein